MTRQIWIPQPDDATRDFVARYAATPRPPFWPLLLAACEAMPRTARLLAMAAIVVIGWPLILMVAA